MTSLSQPIASMSLNQHKAQEYSKLERAGEDFVVKHADFIESYYKLTAQAPKLPTKSSNTSKDPLSRQIRQTHNSNVLKSYKRLANSVVRHRLEKYINQMRLIDFPGPVSVVLGGSCQSGLALLDSCLDLSIETPLPLKISTEAASKTILEGLKKIQNEAQISRLRVSNSKFMNPLDLRMWYLEIPVDVNLRINCKPSVRASQLLASYAKVDTRFIKLSSVLKIWKSNKLDKLDSGEILSGYALSLMLIQYLQAGCSPPVLPCLHQLYPDLFKPDSDPDQLKSFSIDYCQPNNQNLGDLLAGFFEYYTKKEGSGFNFSCQTVSVREGKPLKKQNPQTAPIIFIEEPFTLKNVVNYHTEFPSSLTADNLIDHRIERLVVFRRLLECFNQALECLGVERELSRLLE